MSRAGLIQFRGKAVDFERVVPGTRNRTAGTFGAPTKTTVRCYGLRAPADIQTYRALEVKETEAITLDIVPRTAGECPEQDFVFTWADVKYKTVSIQKIDQNGTVTGATVVGVR